MEPIISTITKILENLVSEKTVDLALKIGPEAIKIAKNIFKVIQKRFSNNNENKKAVEDFKKDPQANTPQFQDKLEKIIKKDKDFYSELLTLVSSFDAAVKQYQVNIENQGIINSGQGNITIGERGVNVSGNVTGDINTGDYKKE